MRRTVGGFFTPQAQESSVDQRFAELTNKQQRVIVAHLNKPAASQTELAEIAGTSQSYPTQVLDQFESLVTELREADNVPSLPEAEESSEASADQGGGEPVQTGHSYETDTSSIEDTWNSDGPITSDVAKILNATPFDEPPGVSDP